MAVDHITDPNMPEDLRTLAARVASGEDPDEVSGIERLWIYRVERDKEMIAAAEMRFFKYLRANRGREETIARCRHLAALKNLSGNGPAAQQALTEAADAITHLQRCLNERDEFLGKIGQWQEFVDSLLDHPPS